MERKSHFKLATLFLIIGLLSFNPMYMNSRKKAYQFKKYSIVDDLNVKEANCPNSIFLKTLDSLMLSARDSFPDKFWLKMNRIGIIMLERRDTVPVCYPDGNKVINHKRAEPTPDNIVKVFEMKCPSNDIEIIFGPEIFPDDYNLVYNQKLYGIDELVYKTLKKTIRFRPKMVRTRYWMLKRKYKVPVFSFIITKNGELENFKFSTIDFYDVPDIE